MDFLNVQTDSFLAESQIMQANSQRACGCAPSTFTSKLEVIYSGYLKTFGLLDSYMHLQ